MGRDFLPRGDGELVQWSRNFSRLLNESPESYHVPPERAAGFALLYEELSAAYAAAFDPATHTSGTVARKNEVRTRIKRDARSLAKWINARPETTDSQRADLALTVRTGGSPIPRPPDAPTMEIVSADGWQVVAQLRHAGSGRRGKGPHVCGALIWFATGERPPTDPKFWKHAMRTSRTRFTLRLPPELPAGSRVWVCARWMNPRGQTGPGSVAVGLLVGGGVPQLAGPAPIRRAA